MANVIPFKGTRYNPEKIKDLSEVAAPPYDVISSGEQDELYNKNPHNIIRILLSKALPGDNEKENRYTRAADSLKDWQKRGVLRREKDNCIYVYLQEFDIEGETRRRLGFIALLKLEEFDTKDAAVYPHENTFSAPKEDRTKLIRSIEANLGPVFAIFADEDKSIDAILMRQTESQPIIDIVDHHGIRNKMWCISDEKTIGTIVGLMKDKKLFIADGHHRYEVGLSFSKTKKDPRFGYILTYFTDLCADGVVILPVHRLISGVTEKEVSLFEKDLKNYFDIRELGFKKDARDFLKAAGPSEKRFVMYSGGRFRGLGLKDNDSLDVSVLHNLIIEPLQKKAEAQGSKISIDFTKDLDYAVKEVDEGRFSLSVMLNPTKVTEIRDMALSGRRMPQKSTYFYPKVLTGLVINVF